MKKYLLIFAAALMCMPMAAKDKKKSKKAKAEVVDTIPVKDFSALIGRANTQGLIQFLAQQKGVEPAYMEAFLQGFDSPEITEADKKMKAMLAGKEIREQVEKQVIPQVANNINDSIDMLDHEEFLRGFRAGVKGEDVNGMTMDSTLTIVRKQMEYYHNAKMESKYGANRKAGEEFLKKNAKNKGVKTTASGLQYEILTEGKGEIPTATQKVKVNYAGTLLDGTEFDSSYKRNQPATFGCNQVIKGWTEALTMMPVGSKWKLYIPQELAYGDRESGKIPPFSMLIFEVELLEIVK